jgi:protein-tyrosine-phosphatase
MLDCVNWFWLTEVRSFRGGEVMVPMERVLFVSIGNSVRSQMAEALLRQQAGDRYAVFSAGVHPEPIDERALASLRDFGCSSDHLRSKPWLT